MVLMTILNMFHGENANNDDNTFYRLEYFSGRIFVLVMIWRMDRELLDDGIVELKFDAPEPIVMVHSKHVTGDAHAEKVAIDFSVETRSGRIVSGHGRRIDPAVHIGR